VLISRAPFAKLKAYRAQKGWSVPWLSSFGSDFNYDFHVTLDESVAPIEYNYRNLADMTARKGPNAMKGEEHGLSVFFQLGDEVFHTYSVYARGTEGLTDAYALLDTTPYGRQQSFAAASSLVEKLAEPRCSRSTRALWTIRRSFIPPSQSSLTIARPGLQYRLTSKPSTGGIDLSHPRQNAAP
jgi:hypothetical protein